MIEGFATPEGTANFLENLQRERRILEKHMILHYLMSE
ncbi:hypothetical protein AAA799O18_00333 [Marine Group I thaumarchaeote SCGC AAA799-O18]|nr:hypothetical protein AAA799O18_00333 [Marine Group I thaumarchaeote SCGC AAA799-O18]